MLLSHSLFIDHEYKADCENKINYLTVINSENKTDSSILTDQKTEQVSISGEIYLNKTKVIKTDIRKIIKEYKNV